MSVLIHWSSQAYHAKLGPVSLIGAAGTGWGLTMASLSANTVGYTKKATANAVQIIGKSCNFRPTRWREPRSTLSLAYGAGNWIGPQLFLARTAPHYVLGKTILAIFFGLAIVDLLVLRVVNLLENRRRNKLEASGQGPVQPEDAAARDLTDKEQPSFRYML